MTTAKHPEVRPGELRKVAHLFRELRIRHGKAWPQKTQDLVAEVWVRLEQCEAVLRGVRDLEKRSAKRRPGVSLEGQRPTDAEWRKFDRARNAVMLMVDELWAMTEAFYHLAWRIREVLEHRECLRWKLPLKSIRDVRNSLIVHPERGGVIALNIAYDVPGGPQLKPFGGGRPPSTLGLYVHAAEFADQLTRRLRQVL